MPNLMLRGPLIGFVVSLVSGCTIFGGKAAEEPRYRVVDGEGDIEIREYGAFTIAHVTVEGFPYLDAIMVRRIPPPSPGKLRPEAVT